MCLRKIYFFYCLFLKTVKKERKKVQLFEEVEYNLTQKVMKNRRLISVQAYRLKTERRADICTFCIQKLHSPWMWSAEISPATA